MGIPTRVAPPWRLILGFLILSGTFGSSSANPPDDNDLVDLSRLQPRLRLDLRYATPNNFTGQRLYQTPRAFLLKNTADALLRVQMSLKRQGFGLVIYDAYRPHRITKALFDQATPLERLGGYVADPSKGSRHNRGCAVDLTLWDLKKQHIALMPTEFDDFSERAHSTWSQGPREALKNRETLQAAMAKEGFTQLANEWWHFDDRDCDRRPILDWVWWETPP